MFPWRCDPQVGLGVGLVALAVSGCATRGFDRTTQIADSMAKQTAGMQAAKPQVDAMLVLLDSLVRAEGDMTPAFKRFSDTLDEHRRRQQPGPGRALRRFGEQEAEYMAAWQQEAAAITSPEVKAATQARQAEVKSTLANPRPPGRRPATPISLSSVTPRISGLTCRTI